MTLRGGPAAKLGNRFEKLWTLSELVRMLRGETDSLRIEPPGLDGVEFVVQSGAQREFHQAKRSHQSGKWNTAMLESTGVLNSIGRLLRDNAHRFVFVSGSDARELADLCEAAGHAESLAEFSHKFLSSETRAKSHAAILDIWNCAKLDAWKILRRVRVSTINEEELETKVTWGLAPLFINAAGAQNKLSTIVDDAAHRTIVRDELVQELHRAGYPLRKIPGNARHAVIEATNRYLSGAQRHLIQGTLIPREAASTVIARLTDGSPPGCVLTGRAGMGKTACVTEIVAGLREAGVHVLAFRLDRHMSATSATDLGHRLDLEESPTLVLDAATKADAKPAVLIVDQLDAVSAMSGRTSEALEIVERLLAEAKSTAIRTLIVCRSFDWQHDPNLRNLVADENQKIELQKLTLEAVQAVVSGDDRQVAGFSQRQVELLQFPQNLSLFLDSGIAKSGKAPFQTTKDLFDRYWDFKRRQVEHRTGAGDHWMEIMRTVCMDMTKTRDLSVPEGKLDQFPPSYRDQCVSENVLTVDGNTYGFCHESFFDYCFARIFAAGDDPLASVLKSSEQHLFRRAQVRQVLAYLRDSDPERYVGELRDLVSDDGVRTHIKDLIFALLADVDDPRDEEWTLWMDWVRPALSAMEEGAVSYDILAQRAWKRLHGAKSWFEEFDRRAVIKIWLEASDSQVAVAMRYLGWQQHNWPDEVAAILGPYADRGGPWPERLRPVLAAAPLQTSRRLFDLFLRLLDNGIFDRPGGEGVWGMCWAIADHEPEWVPEVLAHQLRRCVAMSRAATTEGHARDAVWRDSLGDDGIATVALRKAVEKAPNVFVEHVLPAVLEVSEAARQFGSTPPVRDAVWPCLMKSDTPMLPDACLQALADALAALAGQGEDLQEHVTNLAGRQTFVANYLLLALYGGDARRYADEAVLAFCHGPWRFDCGYTDSTYWVAAETIRATVPHCGVANTAALERTILAYADPYEHTREGLRQRGWASFNLLAAIPNELHSPRAKRRFGELERKFGQPSGAPRGVSVEWTGSPIPNDAAEKMKDEQWQIAIAAYRSSSGRLLDGGAMQLARQFGSCAAREPERFASIGLQLPVTTSPVYFSELLRGLAKASIDDATKFAIARHVFECAKAECGSAIADLLVTADAKLPAGSLRVLIALATGPHDANEDAWRQDAGGGRPYYNGDIHNNGINTTRGRAAEAIGQLIARDASYIPLFERVLKTLVSDPHPAVASCVAMALRMVAYHDAECGMSLFQRMDFGEERLLGTRHVYEFMRENLWHGFAELEVAIRRALRSAHPDARQAGARLACLAVLHHAEAQDLAAEAREGDEYQRRGVAEVASANIGDPAHRGWCEERLNDLFGDDHIEVRKAAASCFRHIPADRLDAYGDLIEAFCTSRAYEEGSFVLLHALKNARTQLPGIVHLVCDRFLDRFSGEAKDTRQHRHADGFIVIELIFRLYQHHQNDQWTSHALDLIDRVCVELDGAERGFEDFER